RMSCRLCSVSDAFGKRDEGSSWSGPLIDPPDRSEVDVQFHGRSPGSRIEPGARLPDTSVSGLWAPVSAYSCGGSSGLAPDSLLSPRGDHGRADDARPLG